MVAPSRSEESEPELSPRLAEERGPDDGDSELVEDY
jgi:hypothetical protein